MQEVPPIAATNGDDVDEVAGLYKAPGDQSVSQVRHIPLYPGPWVHDDEGYWNLAEGAMPSLQHSLQDRDRCSWGTEAKGQLGHNSEPHGEHYEYEQNGDESDYEHEGDDIQIEENGEHIREEGESDEEDNLHPSQSSLQSPRVLRERTPRRLPLPRWCLATKPTKVIKKKKRGKEQNGVIKI